jgi:protein O-mannosyl-transferase
LTADSARFGEKMFKRAALIFCATLVAYFPAIGAGFIWDDDAHVTKPALRTLHGLGRIWFELGATQQYYPVLHSAFWLEHRLWGDAAMGYHLVNILLHATAACLFGLALQRLLKVDEASPPRLLSAALFGALIFALHPVCVESVAWISEQKNTLSTVFYLLSALAFLTWHGLPAHVPMRTRAGSPCYVGLGWYILSLALFILALLSKSVTATLPAALLVVLWWKRGNLSWKRDVVPLLPFFAIGITAGLLTAWVERTYIIGAGSVAFDLGTLQRCLLAGRVIWFYLAKFFWPANLIFIYPRWQVDAGVWWQYLFPVAALALLAALRSIRRRTRGPLAGALFFVGTLFPALGFFNAYPFVFSYVADHFQYLASLGTIALIAGGWECRKVVISKGTNPESLKGKVLDDSKQRGGAANWLSTYYLLLTNYYFRLIVALSLLCTLGVLTWRQCRIYHDPETLYRATLAKNPDCFLARNNLGKLLRESGRTGEAIGQYLAALRIKPDAEVHYNLGVALVSAGQPRDAVIEFQEALRLHPDYPEAHINLARALAGLGRFPEAIAHDEEALRLKPDSSEARKPDEDTLRLDASEAHNNLGNIFFAQGRVAEAMEQFQAALQAEPDYAPAHNGMGAVLSQAGQVAPAIAQFEQALRIKPDYAEAHVNLAIALAKTGRRPEAIAHFEEALRLKPDFPQARANLELLEKSSK